MKPRPLAFCALALALLYFSVFAALSFRRVDGFHTRSFDLAVVVRMLWGLRHGEWREVFTGQPWIAYHFEPVLLPLAGLDAFLPKIKWLLLLQTAALAAAALPAWRLGRRVLAADLGGLVAVLAVLAYPVVGHANLFEFHPVTLALAPGLWLIEALDRRAIKEAVAAGILVASCREDGLLFVALALAATPGWNARRALVAAATGAGYALYAFVLAPSLGTEGSVRAHFGFLGSTPFEVVRHALSDPGALLGHVAAKLKLLYLFQILAPLAFLPLLAPRRTLPALAILGLNLLSGLPDATRIIDCHYSALAVPGLVTGAIFGAARAARWLRPRGAQALLAAASLAGAVVWGAAPLLGGWQPELYTVGPRAQALTAMSQLIDSVPEARVSVPADVVARVADREEIHVFPVGVPDVDFALVDLESRPIPGISLEALHARLRAQLDAALAAGMRVARQDGPLVLLVGKGEP